MTQENTGTEDAFDLDALCALAERLQQHQSASGQQQAVPVEATDVVLAAFLARNLRQGGFAQLIFNAQGQYLGEMAKMLQNMSASNTLHFYEQAPRDLGRNAFHHLGMQVVGLPDLYERMQAAGLHLPNPIRESGGGGYFMVQAPDQVLIECFEPGPGRDPKVLAYYGYGQS